MSPFNRKISMARINVLPGDIYFEDDEGDIYA